MLPYQREMVSLEGNDLVYIVFYYLGVIKIRPDGRGGLWWNWPYKRDGL
jgi:hypothetical protein